MNVSKGSVYRETLGQSTEGEILDKLKDQVVIKVQRNEEIGRSYIGVNQ